MLGGEPSPRAQFLGRIEAGDVTDLGHEDGGDDLAHPGQRHDGLIAEVGLELAVDVRVELGDRMLVDVEEVAQRVEAQGIGLGEFESARVGPDRSVPTARRRRAGFRSWP